MCMFVERERIKRTAIIQVDLCNCVGIMKFVVQQEKNRKLFAKSIFFVFSFYFYFYCEFKIELPNISNGLFTQKKTDIRNNNFRFDQWPIDNLYCSLDSSHIRFCGCSKCHILHRLVCVSFLNEEKKNRRREEKEKSSWLKMRCKYAQSRMHFTPVCIYPLSCNLICSLNYLSKV